MTLTAHYETFLSLLAVLAAVALLARRLSIAPSILLVLAGIALALIPGIPPIVLAPEFVLLIVLPPLIYSAAVAMSWRDFRLSLRPIVALAFGCVVFTTCAVAAAAHYLLELPWNIGFVLGAIVAPPDVVAPLALARRLGLPRRLLVVLEGEGLANDATALILYRFAVIAVTTGTFSLPDAAMSFAAITVGEIAYGVGIGFFSLRLRQWARDPRVEITLSLMTPYLAYWAPHYLGGSGVLATVAAGLYVSWNGPLLIPSATRLQGIFFWDLLVYLIEGFVFLITGLQARTLFQQIGYTPLRDILFGIAVTTAICVIARFVWIFPLTYLPRFLIPAARRRGRTPHWRLPFMVAFVGVRGVVSLAAALALPLTVASGAPFPYRDTIHAIAFGVIVVTLVGQGLMMPAVARWLGLPNQAMRERQEEQEAELRARHQAFAVAEHRLQALAAEQQLQDAVVKHLTARNHQRTLPVPKTLADGFETAATSARYRLDLIRAEREYLHQLLRDGEITDESRRRIERELDLEEASIFCNQEAIDPPL
ncbi:MAG: Na+/H+ antiporter [Xanthobacteraceae bacterium]